MGDLWLICNCKKIFKGKKWFKNPKYIDLIITKKSKSFWKSQVISVRLSNFQEMCLIVMKSFCNKLKPTLSTIKATKHFKMKHPWMIFRIWFANINLVIKPFRLKKFLKIMEQTFRKNFTWKKVCSSISLLTNK